MAEKSKLSAKDMADFWEKLQETPADVEADKEILRDYVSHNRTMIDYSLENAFKGELGLFAKELKVISPEAKSFIFTKFPSGKFDLNFVLGNNGRDDLMTTDIFNLFRKTITQDISIILTTRVLESYADKELSVEELAGFYPLNFVGFRK